MLNRRDFLKRSTLLALAPTVPAFLAQTACAAAPERDGRVLVVVQLDGGNDGVNTVVPFKDDGYAKHRQRLRLPADRLLKVGDGVGLHPALAEMAKQLEAGRLAVAQGVGYPNPSRSHARSMAVWQTARLDPDEHSGYGWLGRALDGSGRPYTGAPASLFLGMETAPVALHSRQSAASALLDLDDFAGTPDDVTRRAVAGPEPEDDLTAFVRRSLLDGYTTADWLKESAASRAEGPTYPPTALASRLRAVSALLKAGVGARVFYAAQPGYDTHSGQLPTHDFLLRELSGALGAFLDDLTASKLADRVAVLLFSEFGRTVKENGSAGTDHGTAGPVFLAGAGVKAGLVGPTPSLGELDEKHGDLKVGLDFRRVYATVLEEWLGLPARVALAGTFERLPLFRS
jgi:uncharacterized protein (DUF1501 family)